MFLVYVKGSCNLETIQNIDHRDIVRFFLEHEQLVTGQERQNLMVNKTV